jgi:DNA-directed RNA polymerase specialized sigma24 family protein
MDVPIGTLTSRLARGRLALQGMLTDESTTRVARED